MTDMDKIWELQTVLTSLGEKEHALANKPPAYAEAEKELETSRREIATRRQRIEELERQRRKADNELSDAQEKLKKFQGQLMQVKNQEQYAAAWKEIDMARKVVKDLEDTDLGIMGELEELQKKVAELEEAQVALQARHDEQYEAWQSSLGGLKQEADAIRQRAADLEKQIPDPLRRQFHQIFRNRQGIAVARVVGEACGECRVRVRPASLQKIQRGEIVVCDGCRRFYYLEKAAS